MSISFLDLGAATSELREEIDAAISRVITSGWYVGGPEVTAFEEEWSAHCSAGHAIGVGNGLDALRLTLRALRVGAGDEVITAANGFIATFLAITATGATPVPVEPDPATHNLDPQRVEAAITRNTRVILPTHLYGQPADLDALLAIARKHGVHLVEDAAQAHGATHHGRRIGAHGIAACWSFYPSKNLGALGDAGAVTTDDPDLAATIRMLRNYGSTKRYIHELEGTNSRLDPLQAAVLRAKIPHLEEWNERRRAIAEIYLEDLKDCPGLTLPVVPNWCEPVWHLFVVRHERRDALADHLRARGIETLIHYPVPPHRQRAYAGLRLDPGSFPIAESLAEQVLSLPIGPHLTKGSAAAVSAAVRQFSRQSGGQRPRPRPTTANS